MTDDSAVIGYYRHYFYGLNISSSDPFVAVDCGVAGYALRGASFEIGFLSFSLCRVLHGPSRPLKKASYISTSVFALPRQFFVRVKTVDWVGGGGGGTVGCWVG